VSGPVRLEAFPSGRWAVERWSGSAAELHGLDWPEPLGPTVWLLEVDRPALVLGSTQAVDEVDADALGRAGIDLAVRRSGGGAVLVEPDASVWIDVLVPRADPVWDDDVSRSFDWLGQVWKQALADLGLDATVHEGPLVCGAFGRRVCFAAIGSGEVSVAGAKAVGLSQRRTRAGARLQATAYRRWRAEPLAALGLDPALLAPVAVLDHPAPRIEAAVLAHLP
jgi:lipoate---protein ligase